MSPDDCLRVELLSEFLEGSVSQLLDQVFSAEEGKQQEISARFDLRANPDLTEIYGVFLAVCDEWRDWRCALRVSNGGVTVELNELASRLLADDSEPPVLALRLEQEYCPLEYAVRHGFWESRGELLDWMRSLMVLYFLDKHEIALPSSPDNPVLPAQDKALNDLLSRQIVGALANENQDDGEPPAGGIDGYEITPEGRQFIRELLAETESYIDQYDHHRDSFVDLDGETVEFGTALGMDLRVQVYMAEGLDPIRTVFLMRLYDGTLDAQLRDWAEVLESDGFFEAVLEPVVNRDGVTPEEMELVLECGSAWLEEQQAAARRAEQDRELLRRAGGEPE